MPVQLEKVVALACPAMHIARTSKGRSSRWNTKPNVDTACWFTATVMCTRYLNAVASIDVAIVQNIETQIQIFTPGFCETFPDKWHLCFMLICRSVLSNMGQTRRCIVIFVIIISESFNDLQLLYVRILNYIYIFCK
jgi:hypothetical protein